MSEELSKDNEFSENSESIKKDEVQENISISEEKNEEYTNNILEDYNQIKKDNEFLKNNKKHKKNKSSFLKKIIAAAFLGIVFAGTVGGTLHFITKKYPININKETVVIGKSQALKEEVSVDTENLISNSFIGDVSSIVEKAMPSVVAIKTKTKMSVYTWFGNTREYETESSGSGIIIGKNDNELLVVTNNHVVENSESLSLMFIDGKEAKATVKGGDSEADIAVLAVALADIDEETRKEIEIASLGDSDSLKVGQGVVAIGNALGYGQSVTVGYVSALNRDVYLDDGTTRKLLQTDAAINPGNSGGALLNAKGEVIAINSAKYSSTSVEGMGYAIPVNDVGELIENLSLRKTRNLVDEKEQGYIGIQGQNIDATMSETYDIPVGVYIYRIVENSAAFNSELKEKDVITHLDGQRIKNMQELKMALEYYKAGEKIKVKVQRLDGSEYKEKEIEVVLSKREDIN